METGVKPLGTTRRGHEHEIGDPRDESRGSISLDTIYDLTFNNVRAKQRFIKDLVELRRSLDVAHAREEEERGQEAEIAMRTGDMRGLLASLGGAASGRSVGSAR